MPTTFAVAKEIVINKLNSQVVDDLEEDASRVAKVSIAESMTSSGMRTALERKRTQSEDLRKDVAEQIKQEMEKVGGRRTRKRRANRKRTRRV